MCRGSAQLTKVEIWFRIFCQTSKLSKGTVRIVKSVKLEHILYFICLIKNRFICPRLFSKTEFSLLVYRCSMTVHASWVYDSLHNKIPRITRYDVRSAQMEFSLTDTQLPMFLRIVEVPFIYYESTCIAQNLIWQPNFFFLNIFFVKRVSFSRLHFDEI